MTGTVSVDHPEVLISLDSVPELKTVELTDDGLVIGAAVTIAEVEAKLTEAVASVHG